MTLLPLLSPAGQQVRGSTVTCFLDGTETCWEHLGGIWGGRLLLYLPLNGRRERDHSAFGFNLATKAFLVSFQFLGSFVSYTHKALPIEQQFCSFSGAGLPWRGPAGAQSNHKARTRKFNICHGLFSAGEGDPLQSVPSCGIVLSWQVSSTT